MSKIIKILYKIFVLYTPVSVLIALGLYFSYRIIAVPYFLPREQIFLGMDIAIATFTGLSFYASYATKDEARKSSYYCCAECFFQATVLMLIVTLLQGSLFILERFRLDSLFYNTVEHFLIISILINFMFAYVYIIRGFSSILNLFFNLKSSGGDG